ncbi:Histone transcription regulator HIRA, WD repeat superfamily [Plasmopara halstedii]|uniref:Protein HIRA n=1 Tax=Plasmopara halstedii TaxID=4781 RepID=A0A0P1AX31_PLAHL|nr:Histone transcription regulator HIRA, WD repeat superfamily [Plasmopara halstedii]CEG46322.1 Histone transcription regulator HIRA, WD repeat superfamily [Plasmopara halstedii]|eukprot:XP_024582691.1 Histone transcription regulator HIRA, WD repeat superfamily [Plasmopara halstedii]
MLCYLSTITRLNQRLTNTKSVPPDMLLEKPENVKHENSSGTVCAIYGVDAHPTLQIFATAGGDNTVKVWSLKTPSNGGISTFELLATLANHQQAVNCVRWAGHGRYLASGSDDQLVLLYELQSGASAAVPFGSNAKPNKQNWVRCSTLERHTMDVADIAWSPDDRMLATCSIDNTVLIWDVGAVSEVMTQPLQTLTGHNSWVKGVAWDPVGKYLSSAGEDKTVRLWKVANWQQADVVTEPFEGCASTSHFRRLSWSPDGSVLCATHAFSSKKNIASLLNRGTWTNDLKFVGHQSVVTSARFNPKLLVSKIDPDKEFACCAVGGEDATVSIWLAHLARPLAVIKDCFDSSVTDLAWSSSQSLLLACSLDGSICCFQFTDDEIGTPISDTQQSKLLQAKYGSRAGITLASTLVENPIQLQLEEKSAFSTNLAGGLSDGTSVTPIYSNITNTLIPKKKKKIRTEPLITKRTDNGSATNASDIKRIMPELVQVGGNIPVTNSASSQNNIRNILGPTIMSPKSSDDSSLCTRMRIPVTNELEEMEVSASLETSFVPLETTKFGEKSATLASNDTQHKTSNAEVEIQGVNGGFLKRKRDSERAPVYIPSVAKTREVATRPPKVLNEIGGMTKGNQLLPSFQVRLQFSVEINTSTDVANKSSNETNGSGSSKAIIEVTVHNVKNSQEKYIELGPVYSTVKCSEGSEIKWIDRIFERVVCVVGNASYCVLGLSNGDILALSSSGRRLFPCIALGSSISVMECSVGMSAYLLVILVTGDLKIWNLAKRKLVLSSSIEPIANNLPEDHRKLTLLRCRVTNRGIPLITFAESNSEVKSSSSLISYTFDTEMSSWMRVADDSFVFSDFASALHTDAVTLKTIPIGPLRRLQNASGYGRMQRGVVSAVLSGMSDPLMQRNVTRSHLEHQVAVAVVLKSATEYRYWIQAYARFLTHDEDVNRLDDLCAEMMGPFSASSSSLLTQTNGKEKYSGMNSTWDPMVLDLFKRDVLKSQILPTIAANRAMQRVVTKYQLMLSEIEGREKAEEGGDDAF